MWHICVMDNGKTGKEEKTTGKRRDMEDQTFLKRETWKGFHLLPSLEARTWPSNYA